MCYMYKLTYFVDSWFNLRNDQCVLWYSVMKFFLVCHTDLVSMESINLCKFMSRCPDVLPDIGCILNLLRKYWVNRCSLSAGIYGTLKKNCWLDKSIVVWLDFKPCLYFNHAPDLHCSCMNFSLSLNRLFYTVNDGLETEKLVLDHHCFDGWMRSIDTLNF